MKGAALRDGLRRGPVFVFAHLQDHVQTVSGPLRHQYPQDHVHILRGSRCRSAGYIGKAEIQGRRVRRRAGPAVGGLVQRREIRHALAALEKIGGILHLDVKFQFFLCLCLIMAIGHARSHQGRQHQEQQRRQIPLFIRFHRRSPPFSRRSYKRKRPFRSRCSGMCHHISAGSRVPCPWPRIPPRPGHWRWTPWFFRP